MNLNNKDRDIRLLTVDGRVHDMRVAVGANAVAVPVARAHDYGLLDDIDGLWGFLWFYESKNHQDGRTLFTEHRRDHVKNTSSEPEQA